MSFGVVRFETKHIVSMSIILQYCVKKKLELDFHETTQIYRVDAPPHVHHNDDYDQILKIKQFPFFKSCSYVMFSIHFDKNFQCRPTDLF